MKIYLYKVLVFVMDIAMDFDNIENDVENIDYNNLIKISKKNHVIEQIKEDIVFLFFNLTRKHNKNSVFELKMYFKKFSK